MHGAYPCRPASGLAYMVIDTSCQYLVNTPSLSGVFLFTTEKWLKELPSDFMSRLLSIYKGVVVQILKDANANSSEVMFLLVVMVIVVLVIVVIMVVIKVV